LPSGDGLGGRVLTVRFFEGVLALAILSALALLFTAVPIATNRTAIKNMPKPGTEHLGTGNLQANHEKDSPIKQRDHRTAVRSKNMLRLKENPAIKSGLALIAGLEESIESVEAAGCLFAEEGTERSWMAIARTS
jgi:hypothetical protein